MKKRLTGILLFSLSLGLFSCVPKKDNPPTSTMSASVNGASFVANSVTASDISGAVLITGTSAAGQEISISIPNVQSSITSYTIDSVYNQTYYWVNTNSTPTAGKSGNFTITLNGTTSGTGTFNFTCKDGTVVTNGVYTGYFN